MGTNVPTFIIGMNDGIAMINLIGQSGAEPPRVKIRLDVRMIAGAKTATVWGTLPGVTDETIYVLAHRDGWFEGASDNASGVATMVGLAEFFAKIPRAQRQRTIVFLGASGHHNSADRTAFSTSKSNMTGTWLFDNRETVFAKAALFINCEHTSTLLTFVQGPENRIRRVNTYTGQQWYAGGPSRPKLQDIAINAFKDFGVTTYAEPESGAPYGEAGGIWRYVPVVQVSDYNTYFHTDEDTAEAVPWTGLESTTRAYAKIIDGVNKLALKDLQRVPEVAPIRGR
ncbi:MAG: M28 family peptidase [Bryobacteraceae bacterium]|nr:M28 family peptidase [Bryobacteraceae bacterium]